MNLQLTVSQLRALIHCLEVGARVADCAGEPYAVLPYGEAGFLMWKLEHGSQEYNVRLDGYCSCPAERECKHVRALRDALKPSEPERHPLRGK